MSSKKMQDCLTPGHSHDYPYSCEYCLACSETSNHCTCTKHVVVGILHCRQVVARLGLYMYIYGQQAVCALTAGITSMYLVPEHDMIIVVQCIYPLQLPIIFDVVTRQQPRPISSCLVSDRQLAYTNRNLYFVVWVLGGFTSPWPHTTGGGLGY